MADKSRTMVDQSQGKSRLMQGGAMRTMLGDWSVRQLWSRFFGQGSKGRNLYEAFGWDVRLTSRDLWDMYYRGGIAKVVVSAYADAMWSAPPQVQSTAAFNKAWGALVDQWDIFTLIHRLDKLSQLGRYSVLVVGNGQDLSTPMTNNNRVLYMQPYSEMSAVITQWGTDAADERFGLPVQYTIYPGRENLQTQQSLDPVTGPPSRASYRVHWSRVIHYAQGGLETQLFGSPLLWACWNYLTDLHKTVGAAAESFWNTANRGLHADIDKELDMDPADEAAVSEEMEEYFAGQRRFIRTRGIKVTNLGSDVADPTGPYGTFIDLIAGTTKIPQSIIIGFESGHQASTQDKATWASRVVENRTLIAEPGFLGPTIMGFQRMSMLPATKVKPTYNWPEAFILSPVEKAQQANQISTAANNLGLAAKNVPNMLSVQEMRRIVGAASSMQVLTDQSADYPTGDTKPAPPIVPPPPAGGVGADGGTPKSGNGSGATATPSSDSNGSGDSNSGKH